MKKRLWIAGGLVALVAAGGLVFATWDSIEDRFDDDDHHRPVPSATTGARLALEDALRIATTEVPGEVIKVKRERDHGIDVIEIKVLAQNGRVRELTLDARDGRIVEIEDD